jgi:hypothetical protein
MFLQFFYPNNKTPYASIDAEAGAMPPLKKQFSYPKTFHSSTFFFLLQVSKLDSNNSSVLYWFHYTSTVASPIVSQDCFYQQKA